ncbi:hypothetical protein [Streptomyces atratus]|uniref:hypothetical protein n=1 Tax=Streptomyces atratus TaxID=1893 RepID=UPI0033CC05C8
MTFTRQGVPTDREVRSGSAMGSAVPRGGAFPAVRAPASGGTGVTVDEATGAVDVTPPQLGF